MKYLAQLQGGPFDGEVVELSKAHEELRVSCKMRDSNMTGFAMYGLRSFDDDRKIAVYRHDPTITSKPPQPSD